MRQALKPGAGPRRRSQPQWRSDVGFLPVPSEGWDTETPTAELPPTRGRQFENWVSQGVAIAIRKGYSSHATGLGAAVQSLMPYNAGASSALFAAAGTNVYNVTSAGAVGAAVLTGTSARYSSTNFTTSGGSFLFICNGADAPQIWNGSAWAAASLTPATHAVASIFFVCGFKERLFFLFKDTLSMGYLSVQSIGGTITEFPLGAVFNFGGRVLAAGSVSRDGGSGMDDYLAILTSEGEVAVYQGTNPGDASAWALVGVYYIGEPVGDRPLVELGGDLGVITRNGLISLNSVMGGAVGAQRDLLARVASPFQDAVSAGASFDGWEGLFVPSQQLFLINAPLTATTFQQFTRNTINDAPGLFTGWNFCTFELLEGVPYAGTAAGTVVKCFDGYDDNGSDITAGAETAWSTMGNPGVKVFQEVRPVVTTTTTAALRVVGRADFRSTPVLPAWPTVTVTNALIWGSGNWGEKLWGGEAQSSMAWRAMSGEGHSLSMALEARTNLSPFTLNGFNVRYASGGQV